MSKFLKRCCQLFLFAIAGVLIFFNSAFYYSPDFEVSESGTRNEDVYHQLTHLKSKMHAEAATDMQQLFPEGYIFMNALYGLAWTDMLTPRQAMARPQFSITNSHEALTEIDHALAEINSDRGRRIFNKNLPLSYGVFYRGWANYLMAQRWKVDPIRPDSPVAGMFYHQQNCSDIARAFKQSESPYLESYHDGIWPADNVVAIASLAAYDRYISHNLYRPIIEDWLIKVKNQLDPATGLIPHVVYEGAPPQGARGSSQSLILSLLPEIDSAFAAEQYALYQKHFVAKRLGLPAIREYPKGIEGDGDIDSGPVIWDIGGAASVVGQRASYVNGDFELYKGLRNSIEAFGFGFTWFGKKRYVFGQLPMADAFIAWSNSVEKGPVDAPTTVPWLIHFVSALILVLIGWVGYKL